MAKRVLKYLLKLDEDTEIDLPDDARVVHVGVQGENVGPSLWILQSDKVRDPEADTRRRVRRYRFYGTGQDAEGLAYVGTCFYRAGQFVWHVFEVDREAAE
jgi:hypothetical protein